MGSQNNSNGGDHAKSAEQVDFDPKIVEEKLALVVMQLFFDHYGISSQNIKSFDEFLQSKLSQVVTEEPLVIDDINKDSERKPIRYEVYFTKLTIARPSIVEEGVPRHIFPNECRLRSLTYAAEIFATGYYVKNELINGVWCPIFQSPVVQTGKVGKGRKSQRGQATPADCDQITFNVSLGKIPAMLRSSICHLTTLKTEQDFQAKQECFLDPGGYFIVDGKEKVLVAREKLPENRPVVFQPLNHNNWICECEIRSRVEKANASARAFWVRLVTGDNLSSGRGQQRSSSENGEDDNVQPINVNIRGSEKMRLGLQFVIVCPNLWSKPIPIALFFKALGVTDIEFIKNWILQGDQGTKADRILENLWFSFNLWDPELSQDAALELISGYQQIGAKNPTERIAAGRKFIDELVLPHVGVGAKHDSQKAIFTCFMIRRVCDCHTGESPYDDRDHLINKRIDLPGSLFLELFRRIWKQLSFAILRGITRRRNLSKTLNLKDVIDGNVITRGFNYSVSTGNWRGTSAGAGISQELNRCCYTATLSCLRRITTYSDKLERNLKARRLHCSTIGMICPYETPEGAPVGLVQNLALSACVAVGSSSEQILNCLREAEIEIFQEASFATKSTQCKLFVNGRWLGYVSNPESTIAVLKGSRRKGIIPSEVSISMRGGDKPELEIRSDSGRLFRPLFLVSNDKNRKKDSALHLLRRIHTKKWRWTDLVAAGVVEELDTGEIMNAKIAMRMEDLHIPERTSSVRAMYTHYEIHPSMMLGLCASTVPFANHNPAPRNTYQSGMAKQSIGMYATNFLHRNDNNTHVLWYPQKPLVSTLGAELSKLWELPSGSNCTVAIMSGTGYNQEDAIIFNKSAIDRGLFRSTAVSTYSDTAQRATVRSERVEVFEKPTSANVTQTGDLSSMDDDGLPSVGVKISASTPIIGKTSELKGRKTDISVRAKISTSGVVRSAFITMNGDEETKHAVILDESRLPQIGDKFASRHGQKGVIGMIYSQEDLPFTKEGIVPDIVLNPHAFPSRMTIGHLLEALAGKAICVSNSNLDVRFSATAFSTTVTPKIFQDIFMPKEKSDRKLGMEEFNIHGDETMYDPKTGEKFQATVFMGVNFYQRLRHMVDDKLCVRHRGQISLMEGQPKRGLSRDGAQRFGEMERDCVIAHGASWFLHERLFEVSDAAYYKVCNYCGILASLDPFSNAAMGIKSDFKCPYCKYHGRDSRNLSTIALPKAAKLLYQELIAMNIFMRFKTGPDFQREIIDDIYAKQNALPSDP